MDRELNDDWSWVIDTVSGTRLTEQVHGSIRNIPTMVVSSIGLVHPRAQVLVAVATGVAEVSGSFGTFTVRPLHPAVAVAPKAPLFFRRRRVVTDKSGVETLFRTVGFIAMAEDGTVAQICGLRIFDDRIETKYHTQWDASTSRHTTGQALVMGV